MRTSLVSLVAALTLGACGDNTGAGPDAQAADAPGVDAALDAPVDAPIDAGYVPPTLLSQTGLYSDIATKTVAPGVVPYTPRWQLWSDGAAKARWIWLPPGTQIDTSDMDHWVFPTGTKLWKEFARGGRRVETRLLEKIGPSDDWADWYAVSFQWDAGESEGTAVPAGVVDDPGHDDIPSRSDCRKCHVDTRVPSVAIGFSALQLDVPDADPAVMNLGRLVADGRLTAPPPAPVAGTYFPLPPGDLERTALGYLHANCGNCHNARSDVQGVAALVLRQDVGHLGGTWADTLPMTTTVNVDAMLSPGQKLVAPTMPAASVLYQRITITSGQRMPPVGRELVDLVGTEDVRMWIAALP
ncbi:MAG: hypothetical protein R3B06_21990 [Kofleriaceae bacterium]